MISDLVDFGQTKMLAGWEYQRTVYQSASPKDLRIGGHVVIEGEGSENRDCLKMCTSCN